MKRQADTLRATAATTSARPRLFGRAALAGWVACLALLGSMAIVPGLARGDEAPAPAASSPAPATGADAVELERQAEAIARSIMSPFCPGRTVSACPNAGPWREDIRRWVAEGVDAVEIKDRLAKRVPEHNLGGVPKNRLGWVLPVGLGVGAFAILVLLLRRLVGPRASDGSAPKAEAREPAEPEPRAPAKGPAAGKTSGDAKPAASPSPKEDWDARLEQELENFEQ